MTAATLGRLSGQPVQQLLALWGIDHGAATHFPLPKYWLYRERPLENFHTEPKTYEAVECAACKGNHLIDLESGEVLPPPDKRSI